MRISLVWLKIESIFPFPYSISFYWDKSTFARFYPQNCLCLLFQNWRKSESPLWKEVQCFAIRAVSKRKRERLEKRLKLNYILPSCLQVLIGIVDETLQEVASLKACQDACQMSKEKSDIVCKSAMFYEKEKVNNILFFLSFWRQ